MIECLQYVFVDYFPLNEHFEHWTDSSVVDNSQQTDTSKDVKTEERTMNQVCVIKYNPCSICSCPLVEDNLR